MAGNDCAASVQLCGLRVARLDASGVPNPGANNLYVSDKAVRLRVIPVISDGEDFELKTGCGDLAVAYKAPDSYKRLDVELELAIPDPELMELLAGGTALTLGENTVGHMFPALRTAFSENGVSVEGWSKAIRDGQLDPEKPYWRAVLPKVNNWRIGERVLENGILATVLSGQANNNANWYDGPANDWFTIADESMTGPFAHVRDTAVPAAACGYATLAAS